MKCGSQWSLWELSLHIVMLLRFASGIAAPLPKLNIDLATISVAGQSAGADMAVQFAIAFSHLIKGVGVVAGQPYNCASHYFGSNDILLAERSKIRFGSNCPNPSGCRASELVPICKECPPGKTTVLDHCKGNPTDVDVDVLARDVKTFADQGLIDDPQYLHDSRIFLFQGTQDPIYMGSATQNTRALFTQFVPAAQIAFNNTQPLMHCWPQTGPSNRLCGICHTDNYDVVADMLQHIYGELAPPAPAMIETSLHEFDQSPYHKPHDSATSGFAKVGRVYVPQACANGQQCRLHVVLHGCGTTGDMGRRNADLARSLSTNRWAEANGIVILWPSLQLYAVESANHHGGGCWDVYGGSEAYAWKNGPQMSGIALMIEALSGANAGVSALQVAKLRGRVAPGAAKRLATGTRRTSARRAAFRSLSPGA